MQGVDLYSYKDQIECNCRRIQCNFRKLRKLRFVWKYRREFDSMIQYIDKVRMNGHFSYAYNIKHNHISREIGNKARKEVGFADSTATCDISASLTREFFKYIKKEGKAFYMINIEPMAKNCKA